MGKVPDNSRCSGPHSHNQVSVWREELYLMVLPVGQNDNDLDSHLLGQLQPAQTALTVIILGDFGYPKLGMASHEVNFIL